MTKGTVDTKVSSRVYPDLERSPGKRDNWVEAAGGLPSYIERIAKHLHYERGMSVSRAIATAVNRVKKWAAGGDNVTAATKAKAAKAVAEWEALKAKNRAKSIVHAGVLLETKDSRKFSARQRDKMSESGVAMSDGSYPIPDKGALRRAIQACGRAKNKDATKRHIIKRAKALGATDMLPEDWDDTKSLPNIDDLDFSSIVEEDLFETAELKGHEDVSIEFKSVGVGGVDVIDETKGIVETIVSVTGLRDGVKDVIHEGAFTESLSTRTPKGVWSHKWEIPVSKTLEVKELPPDDSRLPDTLPNGEPWPEAAGALAIKTQFNLDTQRGREAYSDVVFFDDQQEWSIGYRVPPGGAKMDKKSGVRNIYKLDLYEYSPVLFGAMPIARTQKHDGNTKSAEDIESVHDAQVEYKSRTLTKSDFLEWKTALAEGVGIPAWLEAKVESGEEDEDEDTEENYDEVGEDEELNVESSDDEDEASDAESSADEDDEEEDDDEDDDEEEKSYPLSGYERETLVQTFRQIGGLLGFDVKAITEGSGSEEEPGSTTATLKAAVAAHEEAFGDDYDSAISLAEDFDNAVAEEDTKSANEAVDGLLDVLDEMDTSDDAVNDAVKAVAGAIDNLIPEDDEEEDSDDEGDSDELPEKPPSGRSKKRDEKSHQAEMAVVSVADFETLKKSVLDPSSFRRKNR